jgi:hypothetical protein
MTLGQLGASSELRAPGEADEGPGERVRLSRPRALMEQGYNPARHIKGGDHDAVMDEGE